MLTRANLEQFTKQSQTKLENVVREYCQHLFLSYLYQQPGSERLLFKGGTALRIIFHSPRYSEDLDFTAIKITRHEVEELFVNTLANIEKTGIHVGFTEAKRTAGGYLGIIEFNIYGKIVEVYFEVSLRNGRSIAGVRQFIENDYIQPYTLVSLSKEILVQGKLAALTARHKPRDFYDYFFLLSGNYPVVKEKGNLIRALKLLRESKINFRVELREFLPASHLMHLRNFKKILEQKILDFMGKKS
ncbi:MAG: nucleotidyl transferase AbiEii/AbiGii toxin family protein [Candidatus Sungbacteria bacterium]|nr:nucleotidyl transferase AbiEii/AbiGii toxin family protein [Candidatus Sungbacteria bacterium]